MAVVDERSSLINVKPSWYLINAKKMAVDNKYLIHSPSDAVLDRVEPGQAVQVVLGITKFSAAEIKAESLDLEVVGIVRPGVFQGKVLNDSVICSEISKGCLLEFDRTHILHTQLIDDTLSIPQRFSGKCMVSACVLNGESNIGMIFRESPGSPEDSGWRIFSGEESREYLADIKNYCVVTLASILSIDDTFVNLLDSPWPVRFSRTECDENFVEVPRAKVIPLVARQSE